MTRHTVFALALALAAPVAAQDAADWRGPFQAGQEALQAGDTTAYQAHMSEAARAMPDGHLNRPFVQYHAARAAAMGGRPDVAVRWLEQAWEEEIESLMISFAAYDPAFASMRETAGYRRVMSLSEAMDLDVRQLGGSTHLIVGAGSNVVAQAGDDGVLLIDTGYLPALPALERAVASLDRGEVTRLLITHPHEDHMGAAAPLGVRAEVFAHPATRDAMGEPYVFMDGVEMPPKGVGALPDAEIARDSAFTFNGEEVRVHVTPAHTGGDLVVYFSGSRVAHFGDTYLGANPMMFPGTEDPDGFLDRMDAIVDAMHPETVVVGGHERPVGLREVREQVEATRACMALVRGAIEEGLSAEETATRAQGRFAPQWVGFFYRMLSG